MPRHRRPPSARNGTPAHRPAEHLNSHYGERRTCPRVRHYAIILIAEGDIMATTDSVARTASPNLTLAILLGGLAAGFLDICFASTLSGAMPDRVFKYIAAGWIGLPAARA